MILFDQNFPPSFAVALSVLSKKRADSMDTVCMRDSFGNGTKDEDWIPKVHAKGYQAVISQDGFTPQERALILKSNVPFFVLKGAWGNMKYWDKITLLIRWWPTIVEQTRRTSSSALIYIPKNNTLKFTFKP